MNYVDVHFYNIGAVHSPMRKDPVRLLRIEGENLIMFKDQKLKLCKLTEFLVIHST